MSSIDEAGYLSEQINEWIEKHRKENLSWFDLCEKINKFSHNTMFTIGVDNKCLSELIAAPLYVRAISNFQGVIIMAERGMANEARSLSRCLLENMFAIVAIEKDKNTASRIASNFLFQRKGYLKVLKRKKDGGGTHENEPSIEEIDRLLQENENKIQKNNVKEIKMRELAEKARLVTIYDSAYKLLSEAIHVNVHDLEQYLDFNETGEVKKILWGPDIGELDLILFTVSESMLHVLAAISKIFILSFDESWKEILNNYNKLKNEFKAPI